MINTIKASLAAAVAALIMATPAQASVLFSFTESGGNVSMQTSGTLNTANLVRVTQAGWGGVGIESNASPESDIMGDTSMGSVDTAFGFHAGTDLSAWIGSMFTNGNFNWISSGTTQFTTYYMVFGNRTPGIGISVADMVGSLWTPDVSWTNAGTLAGLGLTAGTYAVADINTGESITIQIGQTVPEPSILALFGLGLAGLAYSRKRKAQTAAA
jgi:hypothetical protein